MNLHIPDDLAAILRQKAEISGAQREDIAIQAIRRVLSSDQRLEATLGAIRDAFKESGMTEDDAVELFETEKHAMRNERRGSDR